MNGFIGGKMSNKLKTVTIDIIDNLVLEKIPVSEFVVKDDGIHYIEYKNIDNNGKVIGTIGKLVLPKETFISAYNAWIKNS